MNNRLIKYIVFVLLPLCFQACGDGNDQIISEEIRDVSVQQTMHQVNGQQKIEPKPFLADQIRQKDINEDFHRDNFVFDQVKGVDWTNPNTFGSVESNVTKETSDMPKQSEEAASIGITPENYYSVSIRGGGNCWLRASAISVLHMVFADPELFSLFIKRIQIVADEYKDVPGFNGRFYPEQFISLMKTLNSLSPQERLAQLNKEYVDKFLGYSFRTVMHADRYKNPLPTIGIDRNEVLKKLLTSGEWGYVYNSLRDIWRIFLYGRALMHLVNQNSGIWAFDQEQRRIGVLFLTQIATFFDDAMKADKNKEFFRIKETFGIKDRSYFLNTHFFEVIPISVNGNHYNLAVKKSAATKFGY